MTELEVLYKDLDRQEQRLYKQLQQIERLERELAESREECRRLREFATKMTKINFQVANYANFEVQWYAALRTFKEIREQANALLAPKVRRGE